MANDLISIIDGGTTRTRVRIWDGEQILWAASRKIGARDVASHGRSAIETAVKELLTDARRAYKFDGVIAFGMITSNVGLHEVPHIMAPATYESLQESIVKWTFPLLGTIYFIPGVKSTATAPTLLDMEVLDVMRGEETEVFGLRKMLRIRGKVDFFHVGSHHKLIQTDDSSILSSKTTLSGEILAALTGETILASSTAPLESVEHVDVACWEAGFRIAQLQGFTRAAFCVRLVDQILSLSPDQATAFLMGAVASQDVMILSSDRPLYLYGHENVCAPLSDYLRGCGRSVTVIESAVVTQAAMYGAASLVRAVLSAG
jgi:2-dehydro-3-deoxygalactonokinase